MELTYLAKKLRKEATNENVETGTIDPIPNPHQSRSSTPD
jgi:hypothetical protein